MKVVKNNFTILTQSPLFHHRLITKAKQIVRFLLGQKIYGPMGVFNSLVRGLEEFKRDGENIAYNVNPPIRDIKETVCVLLGKDTLQYALKLRKKGIIKRLFAGPNISIPMDKNDIMFDKNIDTIITPSQRVADYFVSLDSMLSKKIFVWPAGVEDTGISQKKKDSILIYKKTCPQELFDGIVSSCEKNNVPYDTIVYGSFEKKEYLEKINNSIAMIYLQESESQGLALQEAWIKDIPTLVWNRGYRGYKGKIWNDTKISAPYLTDECGMFFSGKKDFEKALHIFLENIKSDKYNPREYCLKNLSDTVSAKILLSHLG